MLSDPKVIFILLVLAICVAGIVIVALSLHKSSSAKKIEYLERRLKDTQALNTFPNVWVRLPNGDELNLNRRVHASYEGNEEAIVGFALSENMQVGPRKQIVTMYRKHNSFSTFVTLEVFDERVDESAIVHETREQGRYE
jgi:hypothetical protein